MKHLSHIAWFARWAQRLAATILRHRAIVDLLPSFLSRTRRVFYDRRYKRVQVLRVRQLLSDYWAYDQSLVCAAFDIKRFSQFELLKERYEELIRRGHVPLIIDCGANIGLSAYWFATEFRGARVLAVEPDQANADLADINTSRLGNVKILQAAVAATDCKVSLFNINQGSDAFRTEVTIDGSINAYSIQTLIKHADSSLEDLLIVKIDVEGFEDALFETNTDWIDAAGLVIVEPHDWMIPGKAKANNLLRAISVKPRDFLVSGEHILSFRLD